MTKLDQPIEKAKPKSMSSEDVFKVLCFILVGILTLCVKRILDFRHFCQQKGYYVFREDSLIYCFISCILTFAIKYTYFYFFKDRITNIILPKYEGESRQIKARSVMKLFYDTIFYSVTTILAYSLFRHEPWFPTMVGGAGQCTKIYDGYPNWPVNKRSELEIYFMIQLGVHIFSVFEMAVIKRKVERKFYEYLLHHFVAASLILASMMCNEINAGVIILIVHDFSDIFIAFVRAYIETTLPKNGYIVAPMTACAIVGWIYMRIVVFPFCLLANVYINKPMPHDDWYMIYYPYMYLLIMAFVLFGMHIYWTFYILKSAVKSLAKKDMVNDHEKMPSKTK